MSAIFSTKNKVTKFGNKYEAPKQLKFFAAYYDNHLKQAQYYPNKKLKQAQTFRSDACFQKSNTQDSHVACY